MSDEQNLDQVNASDKKSCKCVAMVIAIVLSLLMSIAALATSIVALNQGGGSSQEQKDKVVISKQYDKGQSYAKAEATGKPIVVLFYTDWCGFCQRFAPTYDKIAKRKDIKKNVAVAYVNCEDSKNADLVREFGIEGYPTVFVVRPDGARTRLENGTFFGSNSEEVVTTNILDFIK